MKNKILKALAALMVIFIASPSLTAGAYIEKKASGSSAVLRPAASYNSGLSDKNGGVLISSAFNPHNDKIYSVNQKADVIDAVSLKYVERGKEILMDQPEFTINIKEKLKNIPKISPFSKFQYGRLTSVAMSPEAAMVAVSVESENPYSDGIIVFTDYNGEILRLEWTGKQPHNIIFTPGGRYLLSADEGAPVNGYGPGTDDPKGTVTVIDLYGKLEITVPETPGPGLEYITGKDGKNLTDKSGQPLIRNSLGQIVGKDGNPLKDGKGNIVTVPGAPISSSNTIRPVTIPKKPTKKILTGGNTVKADFTGFDEKREDLVSRGILIKKDTLPSSDFEPTSIACDSSGKFAYVTLQEANSIAVLDIEKGEFKEVYPLGFKDHSTAGNELDLKNDGKIDIVNEDVMGIYMPDGISLYEHKGKTYILTANEGQERVWNNHSDVIEGKGGVMYFNTEGYDGFDSSKKYIFGGRSFSVWTIGEDGNFYMVYDSGSAFEKMTAEALPKFFNSSSSDLLMDTQSPLKSTEPETITTGKYSGEVYAFTGLEQTGGIVVYNITDPYNIHVESYVNSRDFSGETLGDSSPADLIFIPPNYSPDKRPLLSASFDVSGTIRVFELIPGKK